MLTEMVGLSILLQYVEVLFSHKWEHDPLYIFSYISRPLRFVKNPNSKLTGRSRCGVAARVQAVARQRDDADV